MEKSKHQVDFCKQTFKMYVSEKRPRGYGFKRAGDERWWQIVDPQTYEKAIPEDVAAKYRNTIQKKVEREHPALAEKIATARKLVDEIIDDWNMSKWDAPAPVPFAAMLFVDLWYGQYFREELGDDDDLPRVDIEARATDWLVEEFAYCPQFRRERMKLTAAQYFFYDQRCKVPAQEEPCFGVPSEFFDLNLDGDFDENIFKELTKDSDADQLDDYYTRDLQSAKDYHRYWRDELLQHEDDCACPIPKIVFFDEETNSEEELEEEIQMGVKKDE